jgi:hypothetical protein
MYIIFRLRILLYIQGGIYLLWSRLKSFIPKGYVDEQMKPRTVRYNKRKD